jgi:hypothetical protein
VPVWSPDGKNILISTIEIITAGNPPKEVDRQKSSILIQPSSKSAFLLIKDLKLYGWMVK